MFVVVLYIILLGLSVLTASWRVSLAALSLQALGMAALVVADAPAGTVAHLAPSLVELALVKGVALPWFLARRFRQAGTPRSVDLIPPNLVHWTLALFLVALAFMGAATLPGDPVAVLRFGAAFAGVALGMLALASVVNPVGQVLSLLTMENGVALAVLAGGLELPGVIEAMMIVDVALLVLLAGNCARRLALAPTGTDVEPSPSAGGPL